jgi:16S rRNA (cytidine1402-2'-O)-methyltransferase
MLGQAPRGVKRNEWKIRNIEAFPPGIETMDDGSMKPLSGALYVVATPLGNLEDLSPRAIRILAEVDLIAAEDTRRSGRLLKTQGITTPMTSYFEHNENTKGKRILDALGQGRSVALVSDAGTPGISDPGFRLVRDARERGFPVIPVPGPNAAVAALSVSGLPTDRFLFVGFLPPKDRARRRALEELATVSATLVVYESPLRAAACLADMEAVWGDREAFLCREATKVHEEYRRGRLSELRTELLSRDEVKGELVLVVEGATPSVKAPDEPLEAVYSRLVGEGRTRREAVKEAARLFDLHAREVYARVRSLPSGRDE